MLIIIYVAAIITENSWLADSDISCYICKNWQLFKFYTQLNELIIITGISSQIKIINEDFITLQFSLKDEDYKNITLNNVAYISNAAINLFSVDIVVSKRMQLDTVISELLWVTNNKIVKYASRHNDLYTI